MPKLRNSDGENSIRYKKSLKWTLWNLQIYIYIMDYIWCGRASLVAHMVKNPLAMQETWFNPWVGEIPWRRDWQPTPVFLPGEFHRQRSLAGYSPWGRRESDTTGQLSTHMIFFREKLPFLCNPEYFLSGKEQEKWKPRSFDLFSYSLNPSLSSSGRELVTFHILSIQ